MPVIDIPKFAGDACDHCGTDTAKHGQVDAHISSSGLHNKLRHQLCDSCALQLVNHMEALKAKAMGVRSNTPRPGVVDAEFTEVRDDGDGDERSLAVRAGFAVKPR